MAYQMTTAMRRYGRGSGIRSFSDCVCDSGREWCCTNRSLRGDDDERESLRERLTSEPVSTAAGAALVYHGYKRTGSVLWAMAYGVAGKMFPLVAVPVALAQGFGKSKGGGS
jgi:hypothetical protein